MHTIDEAHRETSRETPNLLERLAAAFAFSRRRPTPRSPLRVVSPFHHDAPLVMPDDSRYRHADEPAERHERDRRPTDKDDGRKE